MYIYIDILRVRVTSIASTSAMLNLYHPYLMKQHSRFADAAFVLNNTSMRVSSFMIAKTEGQAYISLYCFSPGFNQYNQ